MLAELQTESTQALEDLRDLARGIYPPLLADKGLGAALEAQARKAAVPVTVETDGVGRYPQEMEAAVYFCCLEALQNVAKYAEASAADDPPRPVGRRAHVRGRSTTAGGSTPRRLARHRAARDGRPAGCARG